MASETWRERIPIFTGRAWAFGPDVAAALIVPAGRALEGAPETHLFTAVDPAFPTRVQRGDFVVGGEFGAGTVDDAPVRALGGAGIAAAIACSFDATFADLALAFGLPALEVNEALVIHTGARLRVDLEGSRVVNLSSGDRYPIRNLTEAMLERLRRRDA